MGCTDDTISKNAKIALTRDPFLRYAPLPVLIMKKEKTSDITWSITFTVRGDSCGGTYKARWGDESVMWVGCPSDVAPDTDPDKVGEPPDVDPHRGLEAQLYLSQTFLADHAGINARPKWPVELMGGTASETIEIFPHSLRLEGVEMRSGWFNKVSVELLHTSQAAPDQSIHLTANSTIRVKLREDVVFSLGLPFYPDDSQIKKALETLNAGKAKPEAVAEAWRVIGAAAAGRAEGNVHKGELATELDVFLARATGA